MELEEKVLALAEEHEMLPRGCKILAAVSGGTDSMCLLHLLHTLAPRLGLSLEAAYYDHRLRGEESRLDGAFVQAWCAQRQIPFHLGGGDVAAEAARLRQGIEETARAMRYDFLFRTAEAISAHRIATAHNADDNAETLLLHLVRGAGLSGLTGIAPRRGRLIRPLLTASRAEIAAYNLAHQIPHREDSSNGELQYTRNFLRAQVVPLLRQVNPNLTETLTRTTCSLRRENDWLSAETARHLPSLQVADGVASLERSDLLRCPEPLRLRAVQLLADALGGQIILSAAHRHAVLKAALGSAPSAQTDLPQGLQFRRSYDWLELSQAPRSSPPPAAALLYPEAPLTWGSFHLRAHRTVYEGQPQRRWEFYLRRHTGAPLLLRSRQPGDVLIPVGRVTKTVKKWMIDEKLPRSLRDALPVLEAEGQLAALAGLGADQAFHPQPGEPAWHIQISGPGAGPQDKTGNKKERDVVL